MSVYYNTCTIEGAHIEKRKSQINVQWENLIKKTENRRMILEAAKEIHIFNRDANDALQRIQVMQAYIHVQYYGGYNNCVNTFRKKKNLFRVKIMEKTCQVYKLYRRNILALKYAVCEV